jgi:hypothetical protein
MSKKVILIVISVGIFGYLGFRFFIDGMNRPCSPPERPTGLPANAKWFGGCDGGNWIELISSTDSKYRFKVYRDWDGVLSMDADFVVEGCDKLEITSENWIGLISYYNQSDSLAYIMIKDQSDCRLKSVFPAYGGEDWEVLQEKE